MGGKSDKLPPRRDENTSAKRRNALGNPVIGTQSCEQAKGVPLSQPQSINPTPMRTLAKSGLAGSAWEAPLQRLQQKLGVAESTIGEMPHREEEESRC